MIFFFGSFLLVPRPTLKLIEQALQPTSLPIGETAKDTEKIPKSLLFFWEGTTQHPEKKQSNKSLLGKTRERNAGLGIQLFLTLSEEGEAPHSSQEHATNSSKNKCKQASSRPIVHLGDRASYKMLVPRIVFEQAHLLSEIPLQSKAKAQGRVMCFLRLMKPP